MRNRWDLPLSAHGQRDQGAHTFELLQQGNFGVGFRSDLFDPPVIFHNPLVQRFDFPLACFVQNAVVSEPIA